MKFKKLLFGTIPFLLIGVSACTPNANPSSSQPNSETPSSSEQPSSETDNVSFRVENPQSGLGNYEINHIEDKTYELKVAAIDCVSINEIKVNNEVITLDANGKHTFTAVNGENVVSISYNEPTLTESFAASAIANNLSNRSITNFDYVYRTLYISTLTNEIDTDEYRSYSADFYSNGVYADVVVAATGGPTLTSDPNFTYTKITDGVFLSYKYDEESYLRAMVPEMYSEFGFAQLLERNCFFDETSENFGYIDFAKQLSDNFLGTYTYPEGYGYVNTFLATQDETTTTFTITAHAEMIDWGEGYIQSEELHNLNLVLDNTSYEITAITYNGQIYETDSSSPVVTVTESNYNNITIGEVTEGTIPELTNTDTIDPYYIDLSRPEIQTDIADGELSKEDSIKILDNIWAYAENTKQTTATGPAYMYDENYNEIPGTLDLTITAYKDYFLVSENEFTPDDKETYGEQINSLVQKSVADEGIQNVSVLEGVVDPYSCYIDYVGPEYNMKKNFSASPLMQDFVVGTAVNEAVSYGLTTFIEESEWGVYGMIYDNYSATKDGNNISIKWSVATTYGEDDTYPATFYQIEIENNFITSISYGDSFEDCLTYHMVQGEYEAYTGTIYEYQEPIY